MSQATTGVALAFGLALGLPLAGSAAAEPAAPERSEFAFGRAVEQRVSGPLQVAVIDLSIYRGSVEPRLADLRVFNAAGEPVPHAIRTTPEPAPTSDSIRPVPLFRLPEPRAESATKARGFAFEAELADDGAIVRVAPAAGAPAASALSGVPNAYLIDLSQLARPVVGLQLVLADEPSQFVARIDFEGSDDLVSFAPIATQAALARLDQDGHRIEKSEAELPNVRHRYLRLRGRSGSLPVEVQSVRARLAPPTRPVKRQTVQLDGAPIEGEAGAYRFDLGGGAPIDRIEVRLPHPNTLVDARLYSAASRDGPWRGEFSGVLYDLDFEEQRLRSDPVDWKVRRQRHIKLVVSQRGGGIGRGVPRIEASWRPEQLIFVARGEPPFTVAYGHAGVAATGFDAAELLRATGRADPEPLRATAELGPARILAGESALSLRKEPTPPRTYALWGVLVLCVALALGMSVRLLRQMRAESDERPVG